MLEGVKEVGYAGYCGVLGGLREVGYAGYCGVLGGVREVGYAGYCGVLGMVRELEGMLVAVGCIHFAAFKWVSLWRKISFCWYQCREERDQKECCKM